MSVKVGIIGAGAIANDHCKNVAAYPDAELAAIADLSKERRETIKKAYGVARAYATWQELVADEEIDAVAIALPNALHAPASLAAIAGGKHVLLDKPFAMNLTEARKVATAAKRRNVVMMLGMNQRYDADAQSLQTMVARGDLGEIYHVKAQWLRRTGAPKFGTWFVNKKLSGGGCLLDIGVHILDLGMYVSGLWEPKAVTGRVYTKFGNRGLGEGGWGKSDANRNIKFDVDDFATALVTFENGATLELNVSWVLHQETNGRHNVELFGTEAGASLKPLQIFRFGRNKGEYEVVKPQGVKAPEMRDCRQFDWLDAIVGKRQAICTMEQALVTQRLLDAIYRSSETGREVRLRS
jgi:predicted dehydrogenase